MIVMQLSSAVDQDWTPSKPKPMLNKVTFQTNMISFRIELSVKDCSWIIGTGFIYILATTYSRTLYDWILILNITQVQILYATRFEYEIRRFRVAPLRSPGSALVLRFMSLLYADLVIKNKTISSQSLATPTRCCRSKIHWDVKFIRIIVIVYMVAILL